LRMFVGNTPATSLPVALHALAWRQTITRERRRSLVPSNAVAETSVCARCARPIELGAPACPSCKRAVRREDRPVPPARRPLSGPELHRASEAALVAVAVGACVGGTMIIVTLVMASDPGFLLKMSDGSQSRALGNAALAVLEGAALVVCGIVGRTPFLRSLQVATGLWLLALVDPFLFGGVAPALHRTLPAFGVVHVLVKLAVLLILVRGLKAAWRIHEGVRVDSDHRA